MFICNDDLSSYKVNSDVVWTENPVFVIKELLSPFHTAWPHTTPYPFSFPANLKLCGSHISFEVTVEPAGQGVQQKYAFDVEFTDDVQLGDYKV